MDTRKISILSGILIGATALALLIFKFVSIRKRHTAVDDRFFIPERTYPSFIEITTKDGSELKVNDTSQYNVKKYFSSKIQMYEYIFEENAKCVGFNYKSMNVWKQKDGRDGPYPVSIMFYTKNDVIIVDFGKDNTLVYKFKNNEWVPETSSRILLDLDIDIKDNNSDINYNSIYNRDVYIPKAGKYIQSVSHLNNELYSGKAFPDLLDKVIVNNASTPRVVSLNTLDGRNIQVTLN
ncbi:uncharacterized protein TA02710 [Theileria annulata]|uniref:Uncharacterized protein n=1 Tax=Theileria annulata TaxID=5874 RepID=Q4UD45_THEAN|nr:uncharacterized protein TA02710 [Theileria annulata]CAI75256.1 hypothetical protein TA02710 [Theileria annulata]|eukprot:XP_954732.1 hypothetical protein TA02710 [Theileria annulata]